MNSAWWIGVAWSTALANPYSQGLNPPSAVEAQPFAWEVPRLSAGDTVEIVLHIPAGYAVYRDLLKISATPGPVKIGEPVFPEAHLGVDPSNPEQYRALYDADLTVQIPVSGSGTLELVLEHQGCRAGLCWPITTEKHELKVVSGG